MRPATSRRDPARPIDVPGTIGTSGTTSAAPDPRMRALVPAQVDPLARARHSGDERLDELRLAAGEREDGAVVIGVGVDVEQPGAGRQRPAERVDRPAVAPLGEVRNRLERKHPG